MRRGCCTLLPHNIIRSVGRVQCTGLHSLGEDPLAQGKLFLVDWTSVRDSGFMLKSLSDWASLIQLVGFPLAILALFLGWRQLRSAAQTARVQVLLALDERLSGFEDVRVMINAGDRDIDNVRLRRYIAGFERVGLALKYEQISLAEVDRFYGQRFVKLIKHEQTPNIVSNREGWKDFYYLWEELRGSDGYEKKLPKP